MTAAQKRRQPAPSYLVTIGDDSTEHESFDAACGHARNELMLGRRPVIIEHGAERFVMDTHGSVERVVS